MAGKRPDGVIFASGSSDGEVLDFPSIERGWGVTLDGNDPEGKSVTDATDGIPPMEWDNALQQRTDSNILWLLQNALPEWVTGTWPLNSVVVNKDIVYRAVKETSVEPTASAGDWTPLFPLVDLDSRYMQPGAFGLGGNGVTAADANAIDKNGIYRLTVDGIHGPAAKVAAEIIHIQYDGASANQIGWVAGVGNGKMYHRARAGSVFGDWIPLIDQNGGLIAGNDTPLILQNTGAVADKKAIGIRGTNSDATMRWFVGSGSNGKDDVHLINYGADAQLVLAETCTINKPLKVTGNFDATGSGNFPGGVAAAGGITLNSSSTAGMYSGLDGASFDTCNMLLKSWFGIGFYNTCTTSGIQGITGYINVRTGNLSMKSTITPGDYSNFDARYGLKTAVVTDCRQTGLTWSNAIGTYGSSYTVPAGCVVVGARNNGSSDVSHMGLAYVSEQVLINGTWKTIGRA